MNGGNNMTGIYKITNKINGKIYVGQSHDIFLRWQQHRRTFESHSSNYALYKAFEKYGFENFEFSVLEELPNDIHLLNEREKYWIKHLHTYTKDPECNGYNMTLGGDGNALIDIDFVRELWDAGKTIIEIANEIGHDRSAIKKYLVGWSDYSEQEARSRGNRLMWKNRGESVEQYSLSGEYIDTFANLADAERCTGVNSKNIWSVVSKNSLSAGGYQWKYASDTTKVDNVIKKVKKQKQSVTRINKDGTTTTYESAAEASRQTGITASQIRKVCQGKGLTAGGYKWYYEKGDDDNER